MTETAKKIEPRSSRQLVDAGRVEAMVRASDSEVAKSLGGISVSVARTEGESYSRRTKGGSKTFTVPAGQALVEVTRTDGAVDTQPFYDEVDRQSATHDGQAVLDQAGEVMALHDLYQQPSAEPHQLPPSHPHAQ